MAKSKIQNKLANPANIVAPSARVARQSVFQAVSRQVATGTKTAAECIKQAGLNWKVKAFPVSVDGDLQLFPADDKGNRAPVWQAIRREDNKHVLSIMGNRYVPIQNSEVFDFADSIIGKGQAFFESGGALQGGRKVFINCLLPGHLFVTGDKSDKLEKRVLFATSHDGTVPIVAKVTTIRVVCLNTFNAALREQSDEIRIRHTATFEAKQAEAQRALKLVHAYFEDLQTVIDTLATSKFSTDKMAQFSRNLFGVKQGTKADEIPTRTGNNVDALVALFQHGSGNTGENRWHALNAVTEFVDHERSTRTGADDNTADEDRASMEASARMESAIFGSGRAMKQKALELLQAN